MPLSTGCHADRLESCCPHNRWRRWRRRTAKPRSTTARASFTRRMRQPYQIVPAAVAFPKTTNEASAIIKAALAAGVSVTPRGAGTGLSGGAIGDGLIVDFARHNRQIWDLNLERRTVRVGAGVVLDQLNNFLRAEGFCLAGQDVATSFARNTRRHDRGMIRPARTRRFTGRPAGAFNEIEIILANGKITRIGPTSGIAAPTKADCSRGFGAVKFPANHRTLSTGTFGKRWPGYGLARALEQPGKSDPGLVRQRGHARRDVFGGIENRSAAGRTRRWLDLFAVPWPKRCRRRWRCLN